MANLKFFKAAYSDNGPANAAVGAVWFDTTNRLIKVKLADGTWQAYSGLQNAEWIEASKQLQLTKADGNKFTVDLSDVASAASLSALIGRVDTAEGEIAKKLNTADQVVKSVDTTADAGVALVHGTDGKLSVSVAEGTVAENNEAVVLGGQVYAAVKAAKEELAGQISGKNVSAEGDTFVSATAENNKVTIAATTKLSEAVAKAESAVQEVVAGESNGTIKVDGTEVAVTGLADAAYATVESLNNTAQGYATTAETNAKSYADGLKTNIDKDIEALGKEIDDVAAAAKTYEIVAITEGLGANVKEAFKLVDEDGTQAGAQINIYKDSALQKVELSGQTLQFTYLLASGEESTVGVDVSAFLAESEFADGLQVADHIVKVKIADGSESFLTVGTDGIKLTGVQGAIDTAIGGVNATIGDIDDRVAELEATKDTVASALQAADITTGGANGTIAVKGTDVAVKGLGSAAYTEASAYATAAQGELADSAVQSVGAGSANGTIAVDGADVAVTGLKSAAYAETTAFDAAGTGAAAAAAVLGAEGDAATSNTVYGAKAAATAAEAAAKKHAEDLWAWALFE